MNRGIQIFFLCFCGSMLFGCAHKKITAPPKTDIPVISIEKAPKTENKKPVKVISVYYIEPLSARDLHGSAGLDVIMAAITGGIAGRIIRDDLSKMYQKIKTDIPVARVELISEALNVVFKDSIQTGILFDNHTGLSEKYAEALDKLVGLLTTSDQTNILVESYLNTGTKTLEHSKKRAMAIHDYLQKKGISKSRLAVKWYNKISGSYPVNNIQVKMISIIITAGDRMRAMAKIQADLFE